MNDYQRVAQAIEFLINHQRSQPQLETVAAHVHLSPFHFQRLFSRWAGVTPKRFLQILTVERAKMLLRESRSQLTVTDQLGLSSSSRLYDHFVTLEAVTPGEYQSQGKSIQMDYGWADTPFGNTLLASTDRGICGISFHEMPKCPEALFRLQQTWPEAKLRENTILIKKLAKEIFTLERSPDRPLSLCVRGTNFQVSVWKALLAIPPGQLVSYSKIANQINRPKALRAVGSAVGRNPLAFVIPCHRVIQKNGRIGGYHWGVTRKHAMHAWESAQIEPDC